MISRKGYDLGQQVEFQDYRRVWIRGQIVEIRRGSHKITGPGVTLTEVTPTTYVVAFKHHAKWQEQELSPKRLRPVKETV